MLFAMGAGDRVIAIGSYDRFPPEAEASARRRAYRSQRRADSADAPDLVVL
jgi:hypothetical protein